MKRRAILIAVLAAAPLLVAFGWGSSLSSSDVESFFRGHTVDGHYAVAIKKRSIAGEIYLATVHAYPTNRRHQSLSRKPHGRCQSCRHEPNKQSCENAGS